MAGPVRVLHVLGRLNPGGVEVWLRHVLRRIDRNRVQMDFVVLNPEPGVYDDEFRSLGAKIFFCGGHRHPWRFARQFERLVAGQGGYDVVHSHVAHYSGVVLRAAERAGVVCRIAHSHNDFDTRGRESLSRRGYSHMMKWLIGKHATYGLACSKAAAKSFYGPLWRRDMRWSLFQYGIDMTSFLQRPCKERIRAELGLPADSLVVGHVGSFTAQKNHSFAIDVFDEIVRHEPESHLLLIGDGPLQEAIESRTSRSRIRDRVSFLAFRDDVPELMTAAMDVFLFPSLYEGLGIVLIEAQAAGLPCVYSDVVPDESVIVPELMHGMSLTRSPADWAEQVLRASKVRGGMSAYDTVAASPFNIDSSVERLSQIYEQAALA